MTLSDFFVAINNAGIRLTNIGGRLEPRGPPDALSQEIKTAALEHKPTTLALLPPSVPEVNADEAKKADARHAGPVTVGPDSAAEAEARAEREAIRAEGDGEISQAEVRIAIEEMNRIIDPSGGQDWRVGWLVTAGSLIQRIALCEDPQVRQRLVALTCLAPKNEREWNAYAIYIRDSEAELRTEGKLPPFYWPSWSTRSDVPVEGFPPGPGEC